MSVLSVLSLILVGGLFMMSAVNESYAEYINVEPDDDFIVKTGGKITYIVPFYEGDVEVDNILFQAYLTNSDGNKITGAVTPSTWTLSGSGTRTLTITAPESAGTYSVVVEYEGTDDDGAELKGSSQALLRVVVPITLTAEVTNSSNVAATTTVSFLVDGKRVEDSETAVNDLQPGSSKTVSYEWVTTLGEGRHTYAAVTEDGTVIKEGEFYVGHNDYQWATIIMGLLFVILVIVLIYIVRKPVKNYGKPKGRR